MVRLGVTPGSSGHRDQSRHYPLSDTGPTYPPTTNPPPTQYPQERSKPTAYLYEDNYTEDIGDSQQPSGAPPGVLGHLRTLGPSDPAAPGQPSGWSQSHHAVRPAREGHTVAYQRVCQDEGPGVDMTIDKYGREVRWCPICRTPVVPGAVHHCTVSQSSHPNTYAQSVVPGSSKVSLPIPEGNHLLLPSQAAEGSYHDTVTVNTSSRVLNRVPSLLPISQDSNHPSFAAPEGTRQGIVVANPSFVKSHTDLPGHREVQSERGSCVEGLSRGAWQGIDKNVVMGGERSVVVGGGESWETPTSLISRLTAGMTARQQEEERMSSHHSCPSPSLSEGSDASSYFYQKESEQDEDPFLIAHQQLMDEAVTPDVPLGTQHARPELQPHPTLDHRRERSRKYTGSESVSSEPLCADSSVCGSHESDLEDGHCSNNRPPHYLPPDLTTLLKSIRLSPLTPYTPEKESINEFLEPEDIGHINHMIKSLYDAVLTISLPDTLYKDKGFTPLDYMDIHLNAVIRQFFFVFKNEDFLNLSVSDQIALLNGCSLRAVCCAGLYLFNQESGCWHILGAASHLNQPVVHISDLLQVYPQQFVTKLYELNTVAAKLDFDWPMGVITNCILMYTPIKKLVQEMDKIDILRNKYVHLLLKYISWKHGHHNAALIFPEILKILDALLLLVDELSTLNLNLSEDEVLAVEERLSTLTLIQMAPLKCQSEIFKETIASWSNLNCVNLADIHNRLCMALQMSMLDSFQSNTAEYWAASSMFFASNHSRDSNFLPQQKNIPQLMPASEKSALKDNSRNINQNISKQNCDSSNINSLLGEKDLMLLRRFLEDVTTGRENSSLIQNIRERMDANQIQIIIRKLCS